MNEQLARSLFMDYLYDEIEEEDRQKLESYLNTHPDLQEELRELQQTRSLLQRAPAPEPARTLLMMEPRQRTFNRWWQDVKNTFPRTAIGRAGFTLAVSLILLFVLGSATRLSVSFTDSGTSISFGYPATVSEGLSGQQAQTLLQQIREENAALLSDYAQAITQQNKEQLQQVVQYFEQQRYHDLQLIDRNLSQVQQDNSYRWQQTNQFLDELLQTVNFHDQR